MTQKKFSEHSEYNKRQGYRFKNLDNVAELKMESKGIDVRTGEGKTKNSYETLFESAVTAGDNKVKQIISALVEKNNTKNNNLTYSVASNKKKSASL